METKKNGNGTEVHVEVVNKAESFWKRNRKKFIQAGEIVLGTALGFAVGRATAGFNFNFKKDGVEVPVTEDLPFEE